MKEKATFKITATITVHNVDKKELETQDQFVLEIRENKEGYIITSFQEEIKNLIKNRWACSGPAEIKNIKVKVGNTLMQD